LSVVPDWLKKALIIGGTAPLPRALRVAARVRGLAPLEVAKARKAQLLLIAHPKCGNTWLKVMISRLYQVRHGFPDSAIHKTDEFTRKVPEVPRLAASNGCYSYEAAVGELLEPDNRDAEMNQKAVVFLARHPCDIAVSWYHQFTKRQSKHKQELINAELDHPIDRDSIGMWDFVRNSEIGLLHLIEFLNGWQRRLAEHPNTLVIRYEDLRSEPNRTPGSAKSPVRLAACYLAGHAETQLLSPIRSAVGEVAVDHVRYSSVNPASSGRARNVQFWE